MKFQMNIAKIFPFMKKAFPLSYKMVGDLTDFIIGILLYIAAGLIGGAIIGIFATIGGALGVIFGILGGLVELYVVAGIVIECLAQFNILK